VAFQKRLHYLNNTHRCNREREDEMRDSERREARFRVFILERTRDSHLSLTLGAAAEAAALAQFRPPILSDDEWRRTAGFSLKQRASNAASISNHV